MYINVYGKTGVLNKILTHFVLTYHQCGIWAASLSGYWDRPKNKQFITDC